MNSDVILNYGISALLLPPGGNLMLVIAAILIYKKFQKLAISLCILSFSTLWLLSLPVIADNLVGLIEPSAALSNVTLKELAKNPSNNRAIVVLSGGRVSLAPEYGDIDTVNADTLQRIQYASWLQKRTQLPVLLSGGSVFNEATAEAVLMNQSMVSNFDIAPKWIESQSKNTAENAMYSTLILQKHSITEILLVTQAWHMERAAIAFEEQGMTVIRAATAFQNHRLKRTRWTDFLPNAKALNDSNKAMHEYLGIIWYEIRY